MSANKKYIFSLQFNQTESKNEDKKIAQLTHVKL